MLVGRRDGMPGTAEQPAERINRYCASNDDKEDRRKRWP
jgi:hypothetical protein